MVVIFLDESGDLGFEKPGSSKKFVVTLLVCDSNDTAVQIRKAVGRTIKNKLSGKGNRSRQQELKGSHTESKILEYFFKQLPTSGFGLYAVVLNKDRVLGYLRDKQGRKKLYNFLAKFVIEKVNVRQMAAERVLLIVDRSKKMDDIRDFNKYLETYLVGELPTETPVDIQHEDSSRDKGLQAVDVFCNSIYRKYEKGDEKLYRRFQGFIKFETTYLS